MMRHVLNYNDYVDSEAPAFTWEHCLLYGAIISATDPVAVVALLKELGASKRLATMIEGESLLNDGTAMVFFLVVLDIVEGTSDSSYAGVLGKFVRLALGGPAAGLLFGMLVSSLLRRIHNNFVLEVNTSIALCYILFYVCEFTPVHVSGILAIVALGLFMSRSGKTGISASSGHSVHNIWGYIGFVAETAIFILTGVIMGLRFQNLDQVGASDYGKVVAAYVILHFIRFICLVACWPALKNLGYGMSFA